MVKFSGDTLFHTSVYFVIYVCKDNWYGARLLYNMIYLRRSFWSSIIHCDAAAASKGDDSSEVSEITSTEDDN